MCVVPTLTFDLLFAFLVLGHGRRQLLWFQVTRHPTAEWLARQITEAFPWTSAPAYLVRDNDYAYGHVFTSRVSAMGIRDRPITRGSPWQKGCAERLIGTLRRECLARPKWIFVGQLRSDRVEIHDLEGVVSANGRGFFFFAVRHESDVQGGTHGVSQSLPHRHHR